MTDNFEEDPNISPCEGCTHRMNSEKCKRCKHRKKKYNKIDPWYYPWPPTSTLPPITIPRYRYITTKCSIQGKSIGGFLTLDAHAKKNQFIKNHNDK